MALRDLSFLTIYDESLLVDITTRDDLFPKPNGCTANPPYSWPSTNRPFSFEPYLSHLSPDRLNIDRAIQDGNVRPIDNTFSCPDKDIAKMIYVVVDKVPTSLSARDRHWAIRWTVYSRSTPSYQSVQTIELRNDETPGGNVGYYINYGPYTSADRVKTLSGVLLFELGRLSLEQRRMLEAIAWNVGVVKPNGDFNCQNWLAAVLLVAVARGLFQEDRIRTAFQRALREQIADTEYVTQIPDGF